MRVMDIEGFRTFCYQHLWYFKISKKDFCKQAKIPLDFFEHLDDLDEEYIRPYMNNIGRLGMDLPYSVPYKYWDYITWLTHNPDDIIFR